MPAGQKMSRQALGLPMSNEGMSASVKFTDSLGRRWHRTRWGTLKEIRPNKYPTRGFRPENTSLRKWLRYAFEDARPRTDVHQRLWEETAEDRAAKRTTPRIRPQPVERLLALVVFCERVPDPAQRVAGCVRSRQPR